MLQAFEENREYLFFCLKIDSILIRSALNGIYVRENLFDLFTKEVNDMLQAFEGNREYFFFCLKIWQYINRICFKWHLCEGNCVWFVNHRGQWHVIGVWRWNREYLFFCLIKQKKNMRIWLIASLDFGRYPLAVLNRVANQWTLITTFFWYKSVDSTIAYIQPGSF